MKVNRTWAAKNKFLSLAKIDHRFITFGPTQNVVKLRLFTLLNTTLPPLAVFL